MKRLGYLASSELSMFRRIQNMMPYMIQFNGLSIEVWADLESRKCKIYDPLNYVGDSLIGKASDGIRLFNAAGSFDILTTTSRCCNYHGRQLEKTVANRHIKFDSWDCPVRGCSVKWWGKSTSLPATQIVRDARKKLYDLTLSKSAVSLSQFERLSNAIWHSKDLTESLSRGLSIGYMNLHECQCFIKLLQGQSADSIISDLAIEVSQGSTKKARKASKQFNPTTAIQSIRSINIEDLPDE